MNNQQIAGSSEEDYLLLYITTMIGSMPIESKIKIFRMQNGAYKELDDLRLDDPGERFLKDERGRIIGFNQDQVPFSTSIDAKILPLKKIGKLFTPFSAPNRFDYLVKNGDEVYEIIEALDDKTKNYFEKQGIVIRDLSL